MSCTTHAFLSRIGALWTPEEFESRIDPTIVAALARAHPELYGMVDSHGPRTAERTAYMETSYSEDLEDILETLSYLSIDE